MAVPTELRIRGLTKLQALEIQKTVGSGTARVDAPPPDAHAHGEIATATAIVVVSVTAIRALAAWLLKKKHGTSLVLEVEVTRPGGFIERRTLNLADFSESAPSEQVMKQLGSALNVDLAALEHPSE